eukprot:gene29562-5912_t
MVPVFMNKDANDYLTLAHNKCPSYDDKLNTWYESEEFKEKEQKYESEEFKEREQKSEPLRMRLKNMAPLMDCNLTNTWNVYQAWLQSPETLPNLDAQDFQEVAELAHWMEVTKHRSTLAGANVGGPIVFDLLQQMQGNLRGAMSNTPKMELLTVSADHTSMLGVLMALELDNDEIAARVMEDHEEGHDHSVPCNWLATGRVTGEAPKVPEFGSMLVMELHVMSPSADETTDASKISSKYAVRLVVQDGPAAVYTTIPLPCTSEAADAIIGSPGGCMYMPFVHFALGAANGGMPVSWCKACNNSVADICVNYHQIMQLQALSKAHLRQLKTTENKQAADHGGSVRGAVATTEHDRKQLKLQIMELQAQSEAHLQQLKTNKLQIMKLQAQSEAHLKN